MTRRIVLDDESEFAMWTSGTVAIGRSPLRVLIAHKDRPIGGSLRLLLSGKDREALYACDTTATQACLKYWKPHALLFDTRLDAASGYQFVRAVRAERSNQNLLLLAMSNIWPRDPITALKTAGFDGHCRRPCSLWRLADLLDGHFSTAAASRR